MAEAEERMAWLALRAAIVRADIQPWYCHALQDSIADSVAQRRRLLDIVRRRAAGLASAIDVATVENTLPAGRREHEQVGQSIAVLRHQLAALVGKGPGDAQTIARPAPALRQAATLPTAWPAELLDRQPDIAAMRPRVEAAVRRHGDRRAVGGTDVVAKLQLAGEQEQLAEQPPATATRAHTLAERARRAGITDATDTLRAQLALLGQRIQLGACRATGWIIMRA